MGNRYIDVDAFQEVVHNDWKIVSLADVMKALREFPAADVKPTVKGAWIRARCSYCGHLDVEEPNYCSHCGSDNRKEE